MAKSSRAMVHNHCSQVERRDIRRHRKDSFEVYVHRVLAKNKRILVDDLPPFQLQYEHTWPPQHLGMLHTPSIMLVVRVAYHAMVVSVPQSVGSPVIV